MVEIVWDDDSIDPSELDRSITDLTIVTTSCLSSLVYMQRFPFNMLTILHVSRVGLQSLAGVCQLVLPSLKELYCAFNYIEDLDPLFGYYGLELVDLEGNRIKDDSNMIVLTTLPKLRELTLTGNPIDQYVDTLIGTGWFKSNIPSLEVLNDVRLEDCRPLTTSTASSSRPNSARVQTDLVTEHARRPDTARRPSSANVLGDTKSSQPKTLLPRNDRMPTTNATSRTTIQAKGDQSNKANSSHQPVRAVHFPRLKK